MTRTRILVACLVLTSLTGYLEWGNGQHTFLFQAEGDVLFKLFTHPASVLHPFVLLPLFGQFVLLFALCQKLPNKKLIWVGMLSLAILLLLVLFIGIISFNYKIALSAVPFVVASILIRWAFLQKDRKKHEK